MVCKRYLINNQKYNNKKINIVIQIKNNNISKDKVLNKEVITV